MKPPIPLASLQNPRVKDVVKLRDRAHRDARGVVLIEGYRELKRALDNGVRPLALFYGPDWYLGENEPALVERCASAGAELFECTKPVFQKMAYRDRPEGLLAIAPRVGVKLEDLKLPASPLLVVAEAIEKPGNLGSILRSADAVGANAVVVCDRCTDINNPNVVRASTGVLFAVPVAEATSEETITWLRSRTIRIVAATPSAEQEYTQADLTGPCAIVVGAEQYGLSGRFLDHADLRVRIPMMGRADSLNVANAATILLYEALRQRRLAAPRGNA